jgi:FkbM family methyltransferase
MISTFKNIYYLFLYFKERYIARKKSYAQDSEDQKTLDLIGNVTNFIDIGANDGISCSNTFLFALNGARGICIEPVPSVFSRLKWLYKMNKKVLCLNTGISDRAGNTQIVSSGLLSYIPSTEDKNLKRLLEKNYAKKKKMIIIKIIPFTDLFKILEFPCNVDLLSIDVEGHEVQVLRSIDFETYSFRLIIIETHAIDDSGKVVWIHKDREEIEYILKRNNYSPILKTNTNTFYKNNCGVND